jgi:hypothetical protein
MIVCGQCGASVPNGVGHSCWSTARPHIPITNVWPPARITDTPPRPDLGEEVAKLRSDVTILKGMVGHALDLVRELLPIEQRVDVLVPKVERIESMMRELGKRILEDA